MQNFVGKQVDRYRITERLGMGGMAAVYKAYDTRLEREVALKLIRTGEIPESMLGQLLKRFEREAKAQARFQHPHIVPVYDYGTVNGAPYLVIAYLPGETLQDVIKRGPVDWRQVVRWLIPIAEALDYAHQRGVIHRDVKPGNILFDERDQPMLMDFGIAKILESEDATLTMTGLGIGTPAYMAPEQWQGKPCPATDQYALGVVLYELITGQKPYQADTPAAIILKQATEPLTLPSRYVSDLDDPVEKLLCKMLSQNLSDRYEDMVAVLKAMSDLLPKVNVGEVTQKPDKDSFISGNIQKMKSILPMIKEKVFSDTPSVSENESDKNIEIKNKLSQEEPGNQQHQEFDKGKDALKKKQVRVFSLAGLGLLLIGVLFLVFYLNRHIEPEPIAEVGQEKTPVVVLGKTSVEINLKPTVTQSAPKSMVTPTIPTATVTVSLPTPTITLLNPTSTSTIIAELTPITILTKVNEKDRALMVFIPEGEFQMGDNDGSPDRMPQHPVFLDDFWIYQHEVTNAQFATFVTNSGYKTRAEKEGYGYVWGDVAMEKKVDARWRFPEGVSYISDRLDHPVVQITWSDAEAYCEWAGGRLPTEAEWEKAARGTDGRTFPWGNSSVNAEKANYCDDNCSTSWADRNHDDGFTHTSPVGSYPAGASPYGALDMAGNVYEWVVDWYDDEYYRRSSYDNPAGPTTGDQRVLRGGSWLGYDYNLRVSVRRASPFRWNNNIGFRCVLSETP
jgi:eukaryotic-like serine/threonine-protein kinase